MRNTVQCCKMEAWGYWSLYNIECGSIVYAISNKYGSWWYHSKLDTWLEFDWDRLIGPAAVMPQGVSLLEMLIMTGCGINRLEEVGNVEV